MKPPPPTYSAEELERLRRENEQLRGEKQAWTAERAGLLATNRLQSLQIEKLRRELWSPKSERYAPGEDRQGKLFAEPEATVVAPEPKAKGPRRPARRGEPKGPKPLDPALPRETVRVPDPDLKELICPESGRPRQPGFVQQLEVLARRPAQYYVKVYERVVFTSAAKTAPVYAPWPAEALPRSRMHASVVGFLACAHYADHQPFFRLEQQLARVGVDLPRNSQVSLMDQLAERVRPLVRQIQRELLAEKYVQLDATPIDVADPAHPGSLKEAAIWVYRGASGVVWFDYRPTKAVKGPDEVLTEAGYSGLLQHDAAAGLNNIGPPGQVRHLACHSHLRRPFFKAVQGREKKAERYLAAINRLFAWERLAKRFRFTAAGRDKLRQRRGLPLFREMVEWAKVDTTTATPKTEYADGLQYLLAHHVNLERCLTEPEAELSNNGAENAVRPLKLGAKNWLAVGHPSAGPRLATLFTLVENCRQAGIDPEAYLIDLIARLPDHPAKEIGALSPWRWQQPAAAATTAAAGSSSSPVRPAADSVRPASARP
jgi:transposase